MIRVLETGWIDLLVFKFPELLIYDCYGLSLKPNMNCKFTVKSIVAQTGIDPREK